MHDLNNTKCSNFLVAFTLFKSAQYKRVRSSDQYLCVFSICSYTLYYNIKFNFHKSHRVPDQILQLWFLGFFYEPNSHSTTAYTVCISYLPMLTLFG